MTKKPPGTNDRDPFIVILSKPNKILQKKRQCKLKNISYNRRNQLNVARGVKNLFYFVLCFQFLNSTNARLHRTGQILDEPSIIRDDSQRDQTHTPKYQQSVLINCYIKIQLNNGEENTRGLLLLKNETEMKKALIMYLGSSRTWKITINDIESSDKFLVKGGNQSRNKHEAEFHEHFHFEKIINPYSFSLTSANSNIPNKKSINNANVYFISTTVSFEVPLYKKSKSNEKIIHRQRTLIVSFEEQELYYQNDDVLQKDQFFNRSVSEECNLNESGANVCENVNPKLRTSVKSRRLVNVPYYNAIRENDAQESSSSFILPVYLESYLSIETILGIGKNKWRILNGFYLIKRAFSWNLFIAMGLSGLVIYILSIKVKLFIWDLYVYKKDNINIEDVSNKQIINNIEGDQINESIRRVTEAITHSDGSTKTTTTTTTRTVFTIEKKQSRNGSNEIESYQYPITHQEHMNENTIFNNEDMSNNLSSEHDYLDSLTSLYADQVNEIGNNQDQQNGGNISDQVSQHKSGLMSETPLPSYDEANPGTSYPSYKGDDNIRNTRESLRLTQGTNESQKECENASYVTADSSFTNSPLHEKNYILQPVSEPNNSFPINHNARKSIQKKAKGIKTNGTNDPGVIRNQVSKSMLPVIESSKNNKKHLRITDKKNFNPHVVKKPSNLSHNFNQSKITDEALNGVINGTAEILTPKTGTNNEKSNYPKKGGDKSMKKQCSDNPPLNQGSLNKSRYMDITLPINLEKENQVTNISNALNYGSSPKEFLGINKKNRYVIKPLPGICDNAESTKEYKKSYDVATDSSLERSPIQDSSIAHDTEKQNYPSIYQNEAVSALVAKTKEATITPSPANTDYNSVAIDACEKISSSPKGVKRKNTSSKALKSSHDFTPTNKEDAQFSMPFQDVDESVPKYPSPGTVTKNMKLTTNTKSSKETGQLVKNSLKVENFESGCCQDKHIKKETNNEVNCYKPEVKDTLKAKNVKRKKKTDSDCHDNFHDNFSIDDGIAMSPRNKNDNKKDQGVIVKDQVMDIRALHKQNKARKRKLELEKIDDSVIKRGKKLFTNAELETLNQIDNFLHTFKKGDKHIDNGESYSFSSESIEAKSKAVSVATENTNPVTSRNRITKINADVQCYIDDKGCLKDDSCFRFSKHLIGTDCVRRDI